MTDAEPLTVEVSLKGDGRLRYRRTPEGWEAACYRRPTLGELERLAEHRFGAKSHVRRLAARDFVRHWHTAQDETLAGALGRADGRGPWSLDVARDALYLAAHYET